VATWRLQNGGTEERYYINCKYWVLQNKMLWSERTVWSDSRITNGDSILEMELDIDGIKVLLCRCCSVSKQAITALQFSRISVNTNQFTKYRCIHNHKPIYQIPLYTQPQTNLPNTAIYITTNQFTKYHYIHNHKPIYQIPLYT